MKKLNNKGWGLATFVTILAVLFLALLVVVFLVNYFDTGLRNKNPNNLIFDIPEPDKVHNYPAYEGDLIERAKSYKLRNNINLEEGQSYNISVRELGNLSGYEHCRGYVTIDRLNERDSYQAFINCGSYQSNGYNSSFE